MKRKMLAILVLTSMASTAMADGFYGALDIGQSKARDMCSATNFGGNTSCSTTATAYRIGGGYNFSQNFGVEVNYADLGNVNPVSSPGYDQSTKATTLQAAAVGYLQIANGFSLIGKLGIAQTKFKQTWNTGSSSASDTNLAYGVGAQYDFSESLAARAQYEDFGNVGALPITATSGTGRSKVSLLSAGLVFKFQ